MSDDGLYVPLADSDLRLELLREDHREGLRAACAQDAEIWQLYPFSYWEEAFDPQFDSLLRSAPQRRPYAVFAGETLVGMTAWIEHGAPGWSVEIGNSYIVPSMRGTGFNRRLKYLMLNHAFASGIERVCFKVDVMNTRSQAAVRKIGGVQEGVMRRERRTWTGRVRDTVMFSILRDDWLGASA
ncbi:GNAT family protein [Novosphingobium sp.]|uniref:GNAT family N-acetyltransferase n=1 Tax=Novosphingobium sp. TaxID=1874826 RepID=UPI0026323EDB|nr:GNAT family protein [Novosphingobium sp.]